MARADMKTNPERKRSFIMQKAVNLFMAKGFEGTSTNDICVAAKLTKPSLYHYFESKNHLLFCIHKRSQEEVARPYINEVTSITEPGKRLEAMIRGYARMICSHPELRFMLHGSLTIFRDKRFVEIRQEWKKFYILIRDTISELQSIGRISQELRPSWVSLQILGMITWTTFWFDYKRRDQIDQLADSMVEMAFHGIGFKSLS